MPEFALLFRSRSDLDPEQVARRGEAVRAWAIALRDRGTLRNAVLFAPDGLVFAHEREPQAVERGAAVSGVSVIEAADHEAAIALVRTFPAIPYGTTVELRPLVPLPTG